MSGIEKIGSQVSSLLDQINSLGGDRQGGVDPMQYILEVEQGGVEQEKVAGSEEVVQNSLASSSVTMHYQNMLGLGNDVNTIV